MTPPVVVACMKRVELLAGVDPLSGDVLPDPSSAGPSQADTAALEWALRIAEACGGAVVAVSVGGPECDAMLRDALGAGAARAVRVPDGPEGSDPASTAVARSLARAVAFVAPPPARPHASPSADGVAQPGASVGAPGVVVCCGDASVDRGSGSVPAFLAGELGIAQALGLVGVSLATWVSPGRQSGGGGGTAPSSPSLEVERRLDRGRRERLRLTPPFVMSLEAGTARLRRASLQSSLAAREAVVEVLPHVPPAPDTQVRRAGWEPYRPRTRLVPPPEPGLGPRARIAALTGALHERPAARTLVLDAEDAAGELLSTLAAWGELPVGVGVAEPGSEEAALP